MVDISVIIVNYNVKEYVTQLISSLQKAQKGLKLEIFVVDNASYDGSVPYLKKKFGDTINLISLEQNLGFGKANNIALKAARGKYSLIINPDTIVEENSLLLLRDFMAAHPDAGLVGCKILNPDGSFAQESKRAIPEPASAFWRMFGFYKLFRKNRNFAEYYVPWVGENETSEVPAISGAIMFGETEILKKVDGFDERFFMYGEDLDLCLKISESGKKIFYYPETSIIHFKGESTNKESFDYFYHFYNAMNLFFQKHYTSKYNRAFRALVQLGIVLRGIVSLVKSNLGKISISLFDTLLINIVMMCVFWIRFSLIQGFESFQYNMGFVVVHILISLLFLFFSRISASYRSRYLKIGPALKSLTLAFVSLAAVTFFIKDLAFSRLVTAISFLGSFLVISGWRLIISLNRGSHLGQSFQSKVLLAGVSAKSESLILRLIEHQEGNIQISGIVMASDDEYETQIAGVPVVGSIHNFTPLLQNLKPDMVIFVAGEISYEQIINSMQDASRLGIIYKIIPENLNVLIGKSYVSDLEDLPLIDLSLPYWKSFNQLIRRGFDILFGLIFFLFLLIPKLYVRLRFKKLIYRVKISYGNDINTEVSMVKGAPISGFQNTCLLISSVLSGKISFVGASISENRRHYSYKAGITGSVQQSKEKLNAEEENKIDISYLKNYSIGADILLIVKWLLGR